MMEDVTNKSDELDDTDLLKLYIGTKREEYVPVFVFYVVIIFFGIAGNSLAFLFYRFKARKTISSFFLAMLAANDLLASILKGDKIYQLYAVGNFTSSIGCKLLIFVNHVLVLNSGLFIIAMNIDRCQHVCWPFSKWGFTDRSAKFCLAGLVVLSIAIGVPNFFVTDSVAYDISMGSNVTITGYRCTHSKLDEYQIVITIFHMVDLLTVVVTILSAVVIYTLIAWRISRSSHQLKSIEVKTAFSEEICKQITNTNVVHKNNVSRGDIRSIEIYSDTNGVIKDTKVDQSVITRSPDENRNVYEDSNSNKDRACLQINGKIVSSDLETNIIELVKHTKQISDELLDSAQETGNKLDLVEPTIQISDKSLDINHETSTRINPDHVDTTIELENTNMNHVIGVPTHAHQNVNRINSQGDRLHLVNGEHVKGQCQNLNTNDKHQNVCQTNTENTIEKGVDHTEKSVDNCNNYTVKRSFLNPDHFDSKHLHKDVQTNVDDNQDVNIHTNKVQSTAIELTKTEELHTYENVQTNVDDVVETQPQITKVQYSAVNVTKTNEHHANVKRLNAITVHTDHRATNNHKHRTSEIRITAMMFAMTLGTVLCVVPYFYISLMGHEGMTEDEFEMTARARLFRGSFAVYSTLNPYVIGVFYTEFRAFVFRLVKRGICCCFSR